MSKKKIISFFSNNWSWLLSGLIVFAFFIIFLMVNNIMPFGTKTFAYADSHVQYVPFMKELQRKFADGESLNYSWYIGFGQNFWALFLYYLSSPLNLILFFLPDASVMSCFAIFIVIKISLSASTFGYYLAKREEESQNNCFILVCSLFYALCGWSCTYYWNIMWLDGLLIFPVVMLGLERLIYKKDFRLYCFALFFAIVSNFYTGLIICIFISVYFFIMKHKDIDNFIYNGFRFLGYSVLSGAMAGLTVITTFYVSLGVLGGSTDFSELGGVYDTWSTLITSVFFNVDSPFFATDNMNRLPVIYSGVFAVFAIFLYVFSNNFKISEKIKRIGIIVFLFISINVKFLSYTFSGFHVCIGLYARFAFIISFLLIVLMYDVLLKAQYTHKLYVILAIICTILCYLLPNILFAVDYIGGPFTVLLTILMITCYGVIYYKKEHSTSVKSMSVLLCVIMCAELFINSWNLISLTINMIDTKMYTKEDVGQDISVIDNSPFYRNMIVRNSDEDYLLFTEYDMYYQMMNIDDVNSTISVNALNMAADAGLYISQNFVSSMGANHCSNDLFGIKYIYVDKTFNADIDELYEKVGETEKFDIYKNNNALSIAFCVPEKMLEYKSTLEPSNIVYNYMADLYDTDSIFESVDFDINVSDDYLEYDKDNKFVQCFDKTLLNLFDKASVTFTAKEDGYYYFDTSSLSIGKDFRYYKNDVLKDTTEYEIGQFINLGHFDKGDTARLDLLLLTEAYKGIGENHFLMEGEDGFYVDVFRVNNDSLNVWRENLSSHQLSVTKMQDNVLEGTIDVADDSLIYVTVPYDEGWSVYLDDIKVPSENILKLSNGTMAVRADKGYHTFAMKFIPQGFRTGVITSVVGWCLYILLFVLKTKNVLFFKKKES